MTSTYSLELAPSSIDVASGEAALLYDRILGLAPLALGVSSSVTTFGAQSRFQLAASIVEVRSSNATLSNPFLVGLTSSIAALSGAADLRLLLTGYLPSTAPTTRSFQPPSYRIEKTTAMNGRVVRQILCSKPSEALLTLEYVNISDTYAEEVLKAYDQSYGSRYGFKLPLEALSGATTDLLRYINLESSALHWFYASAPSVESVVGGLCILRVELSARLELSGGNPVAPGYGVRSLNAYAGRINIVSANANLTRMLMKWTAFTTENETYVNSHSIELDSQGNTYAFIAGGNGAHSEVTKLSSIGELLGVWRVTSYLGQPQTGNFNGPDNKNLAYGQTIHRINDDRFLLCIVDRGQNTSLILLDSNGTVIYNKAYLVQPYGAPYRTLSIDKSKFIIVSDGNGFNVAPSACFFDVATGACIKRITFSNVDGQLPWIIRAVVERLDGKWAFYVRYSTPPYAAYFIETDSALTAVNSAAHNGDLPLSSSFCVRPDADGYLVLNSSGYIQHLDNNFNLVESRKFAGWPTGIMYDSNGNYLVWSNYTNWYQDIGGISGWPWLLTLIKYNWNSDFVSFVTMANTHVAAAATIDPVLQRISFAAGAYGLGGGGSTNIPPYRQVSSLNFIQLASSNGLPITTPNPPGFSFSARTVLNPTPRPTIESPVYTQRRDAINIIPQPLPTEQSSTFVVEPVTRTWQLDYTPD